MLSGPAGVARICIDIIIFIIIGLSAAHGWKKGLASVLFSCFRWIICIVVAVVFDGPFKEFFTDLTGIDEAIHSRLKVTMSTSFSGNTFFSVIPEQLQGHVEGYQQNIANQIATSVSDVLVRVISFLVLAILIIVITGIIAKLLESRDKESPIGFANGLFGLVFGLLRGVFMVGLLMLIVFSIIGFTDPNAMSPIVSGIRSSYLAGIFYDHNPILIVFDMF